MSKVLFIDAGSVGGIVTEPCTQLARFGETVLTSAKEEECEVAVPCGIASAVSLNHRRQNDRRQALATRHWDIELMNSDPFTDDVNPGTLPRHIVENPRLELT